jgi:WD40 repeat protein
LCLWDFRQDRAGGRPLAELRSGGAGEGAAAVLSLSTHPGNDALVLEAGKDSALRLWDFRALAAVRTLRAPGFSIGCVGTMGRARCTASISADGRWVAAGGADGGVFVWDLRPPPAGGGAVGVSSSLRRLSASGSSFAGGAGGGGGGGGGSSSFTAAAGAGGGTAGQHGAAVARLSGLKEQVAVVGWSADCRTLAAADKAGSVAFWSVVTGSG